MPLTITDFKNVADSTLFSTRDIKLSGEGENASAQLGNFIFSAGKTANKAVMQAFKAALENEYGALGIHAFDTVLTSRAGLAKSLRACDVKDTLSQLQRLRKNRFVGEVNRQLDTSPKFLKMPENTRLEIRRALHDAPFEGCNLAACKTPADVAAMAKARIDRAIDAHGGFDATSAPSLGPREDLEMAPGENEATGLKNLKTVMDKRDASVEDKIKKGVIGTGMRLNRSTTNPMLLEKLKTNGVEPGFIYRNDWSKEDTRGFMADIPAGANRAEILASGRAHPAGVAAAAEFLIQKAAQLIQRAKADGKELGEMEASDCVKNLAKALSSHFRNANDINALAALSGTKSAKAVMREAKLELFVQIRDAVIGVKPEDPEHEVSPIFKHFSERHIMKLDYNEGDKLGGAGAGSAGKFRRPERILATRNAIYGPIYRFMSRQSAQDINAGAVTEALANDLTRLAGVPSQDLRIVRGKYSDGKPKLMLEAKFAKGYKDMEDGMLKDGRAIARKNEDGSRGAEPEPIGKYKAFFLLTADRDGVGKRGQNKGFINGKFFAIDPGHSLEGNGKYLDISDDFSFKDTFGKSTKPRFNNFSVFDDDTRFAKLSGLAHLREIARSGAFRNLFQDYKNAFDPHEENLDGAEIALRQKIHADIDKKKEEFDTQLSRLEKIFAMQLSLYDKLSGDGEAMQEGAINTLSHLEMLSSPTTWVSKHGEVALKHLEVKPETRVPWRAGIDGGNIVYHCDKPLGADTRAMIAALLANTQASLETDALGITRLTIPKEAAQAVFAALSEDNIQKLTHPDEYAARHFGGDELAVARDFVPAFAAKPQDPRPALTADQLPDTLDIEMNGEIVQYPKIHYEKIATTESSIERPRTVEDLKAILEARARRGFEILLAVRSGDLHRFEPSRDNMIAVTHALHHAALQKGQYMYRGSFSIADPDGYLARWLDGSKELYARASTHAKPYHSFTVDGHRNEARGFDAKSQGMDSMLNGMRTFHYFTIPDPDHLNENDGGSGPRRRLFFKCETYGVFKNKISSANAKASFTADMKARSYIFGDVVESIAHGMSLIWSLGTPKEMPGIHKENLLESQKKAIDEAARALSEAGLGTLRERLLSGEVLGGAGIRKLFDNLTDIYEHHMPQDEAQRTTAAGIFDTLVNDLAETTQHLSGPADQRLGNEIMID